MDDKEAFDKIRDITVDFMAAAGETEADRVRMKGFYLQDGFSKLPSPNLYDASGQCIGHPVRTEKEKEKLGGGARWSEKHSRPVIEIVKTLREQDTAAGRPPRNIFDMTVYPDGRYEVKFIHDPELDARRKAELEEKERQWEEEEQAAWDALSDEEKAAIEAHFQREREIKEQLNQLEQLREEEPEDIGHILEYIRLQAELVAPMGWRRIQLEFGPGKKRDDGKKVKALKPTCIREDGEEEYLNLYMPISVMGAIEEMQALLPEERQSRERIVYTIEPGRIDYEWQ